MAYVHAYAPARTELAGNHTDHQGGRAIAATLDCGIDIVAKPADDGRARVVSAGEECACFDVFDVAPHENEMQTSAAIARGCVACLRAIGIDVGGFTMQVESTVPIGAGLSSSAAFELAILEALIALSGLEGDRVPSRLVRAGMAAHVERAYFGKPCGLLDQTAIAFGGIAALDFAKAWKVTAGVPDAGGGAGASAPFEAPVAVSPIDFDFDAMGLDLYLIDSTSEHAGKAGDYASIPEDMRGVARMLGAEALSQVPYGAFAAHSQDVRERLGDTAFLRALHYYNEMRLVDSREAAMRAEDADAFLRATRESAMSSAAYLQNVSVPGSASQPAMAALAVVDMALAGEGACRIHGGGFGGYIQAFVPHTRAEQFERAVEQHLGAGACKRYRVTREGSTARWE